MKDELYKGTSKGAEGFAARLLFKDAKDLGMNVAISWQDNDSSTSKAIKYIFPEAEIMLCRGHEGRSHLKQLRKLQTMKTFSSKVLENHRKHLRDIKDEKCKWCKCEKRHAKGCGCFTDTFIMNSRNLLSHIISTSDSEEEFARRVRTSITMQLINTCGKMTVVKIVAVTFTHLVCAVVENAPTKPNTTAKERNTKRGQSWSVPFTRWHTRQRLSTRLERLHH